MNITTLFNKPKFVPVPILCHGNDLASICRDIEARGGVVNAMDAGVGGKNGQYRVFYFERGESNPPMVKSTVDETAALAGQGCSEQEPATLNPVPGRSGMICEVTGKSQRERQMEETPLATENPSNSIQARMDRLRLKAIESGRVTKTVRVRPTITARLPHNSE